MKQRRSSLLLATALMLTAGCDVPWTTVGAVAAAISGDTALAVSLAGLRNDNSDDSWWEENDEHFDWHFWPFN